jgi:3-(3-hydroxy-phenyl)propionate hydroxylase
LWDRVEARRILVLPKGSTIDPTCTDPVWVDRDGALATLLGEPSGQLLLLRPDRYVAAIFPLAEEQIIADGFATLLGVQQIPAGAVIDPIPLAESLLRNSR